MTARRAIVALWICIVAATVVSPYATRSTFAEVDALGGVVIVIGCAAVALVTLPLVRRLVVLALTAGVAAILTSTIAWAVLHDESSTAAIGVLMPPFVSAGIAIIGIAVNASLDRAARAPSRD